MPMPMPDSESLIGVLVVDDSRDIADLYCRLIDETAGMRCVGTLSSADHLLREVESLRPEVVMLDLTMPGKSPLAALNEVAVRCPATRVIAFSGYDDRRTIDAAIDAGAWGLISKHLDPVAAVDALLRVARGEVVLPLDGARDQDVPSQST